MALKNGIGRCVKCNHKCVSRCIHCSDHVCYFHSSTNEKGQKECFKCVCKYYIIEQATALEKAEMDAEFAKTIEPKCYNCGAFAIVECALCNQKCCTDHRVQRNDYEFACLDCYYQLQDIEEEQLRHEIQSRQKHIEMTTDLGGES